MCNNPQTNQQGNTYSCGKCEACHSRYIQQWIFRLKNELNVTKVGLFVTLTYDYAHVPMYQGKFTLSKRHPQLFMKRLRKALKGRKIKYVLCGEYGSVGSRPHYHAILFNVTDDDFNVIQAAWGMGSIHVGQITPSSIAYTFKYAVKEDFKHRDYRQIKPFIHMSKGLGEDFAFTITYNQQTGIDKNGKQFVRYSKVRTPKPHFQRKLDQMLVMPYYIVPIKRQNVKIGVPKFYLRAANYNNPELGEMYKDRMDTRFNHYHEAKREAALQREAIQKGVGYYQDLARKRLFTISKEKI